MGSLATSFPAFGPPDIYAVIAFFATPLGRWVVIAALVAMALFTGAIYERNVQHQKDLADFDKERQAQTMANLKAVGLLDAKYRKKEQDDKVEKEKIGADYEKKLADKDAQRARDVASARAGSLRLSIPSNCPHADGSSPAQTSGLASSGDDPTRTYLPQQVTSDLFALADDADAVVAQLTACQAVIVSDRQPTKGSP